MFYYDKEKTKLAAYIGSSSSVAIPNSVTSIGNFAFYGCSNLKSVTIPNSVISIGNNAFFGCSSLKVVINYSSLYIKKGSEDYGYIGYYANIVQKVPICDGDWYYYDEEKTQLAAYVGSSSSVAIPNSVTSIGSNAFYGCKSLQSVTIPNSVTSIEKSAFYGCSCLQNVTIPNSVTSIEQEAFYGCSKLKSIIIGTGVRSIGKNAFYDCPLHKVTLLPNTVPSGVRYGSITYVANNNYSGSSVKKYDYLSSYFEVDGIRYVPISPSERTCAAIDCTYDSNIKNIKMGESVNYRGVDMKIVEINPYVLIDNDNVESIDISSPADIQNNFAKSCNNVKSIKLDNTGYVGESTFSGCEKLVNVVIPSSVESIGKSSFANCTSLSEITLNEGLKTIGEYAFQNTNINSISIPSSTNIIGNGSFNGCKSLAKFEAKDGEEKLSLGYNNDYNYKGLFYDCPLKEVVIGRNLVYETSGDCGYSPFYRSATLEKVTLTDIPTEVFTNEFYGCSSLKEVSIGDGVAKIGDYAFSGCSAIETFSFGMNVKEIGDEAFSDCTNMTKLYAEPTTPPTCGTQALDDINKWNCTLYVEPSAMDAYKAADQWKEFFFMEANDYGNSENSIDDTLQVKESNVVYTISGVLVNTNATPADLKSLPKGVYIINSKKMVVK